MENASKALLIAAGTLVAIILLSLIVIMYNNISDYYKSGRESTKVEQIAKFNGEYEAYNRKDVSGSDLLSLVNKIVDYNDRKAYPDDEQYQPMGLIIEIGVNDVKKFYFDLGDYNNYQNERELERNHTIIDDKYEYDFDEIIASGKYGKEEMEEFLLLTSATNDIKTDIKNGCGITITDNIIPLLSQNIYNIFDVYNYNSNASPNSNEGNAYKAAVNKRENVFKEMFGQNNINTNEKIFAVEKAAYKAYQITQFKRANFKCTGTKYNESTGRIVEMSFEFNGGI